MGIMIGYFIAIGIFATIAIMTYKENNEKN